MSNKVIIILFFALVSLTFISNLNIVKAVDCPAGDNQKIETLFVNGCYYEVTICYKCVETSPYGLVNVFSFRKLDPNCNQTWNTDQVLQNIYSQVYTWDYIKTYICLSDNVGPCEPDDAGIFFQYNHEICWQKRLEADGTILYYPCSSGNTYCYAMFKMCWDTATQSVRITQLSPYEISGDYEGRCQGMSEPLNPTIVGIPTACFEVQTMCTP